MSRCSTCHQEKTEQVGCREDCLALDGHPHDPIRRGEEIEYRLFDVEAGACPDCLVPVGSVHHRGCSLEECPCCHRTFLFCWCRVAVVCGRSVRMRQRAGRRKLRRRRV